MNISLDCFDWSRCVLKSKLPSNSKYLALYLKSFMNSDQDIAWPSQSRIAYETGLSEPTIRKHLGNLEKAGWLVTRKKIRTVNTGMQNYHHNEYHICFPDEMKQIVNGLPSGGSRGKIDTEQRVNESRAEGKQLTPNNNRITKNNNSRFTPPNLKEIKEFCLSRQNHVNPEKFHNFYESKNWMVGKNKMMNWQAAIRTWEQSESGLSRHDDNRLAGAI